MSAVDHIKNYFFPVTDASQPAYARSSGNTRRNLAYYISPVQFQRIKNDLLSWRKSAEEAELPLFPQRIRMQRLFMDTVLNGHVESCMTTRKDLTLLRPFKICDQKGIASEDLTAMLVAEDMAGNESTAAWFQNFISYVLDALYYGYSLIALGDIENDAFPDLSIIKRWNVSPDRHNVTAFIYSTTGQKFLEPPFADWHIWVPTPSDLGVSQCGYGLLYKVAYYEIFLKNNTGYNADFIELFGQPLRVGKTTKTEADERDSFEASLRDMGSVPYIMLDEGQDEVEFVESKSVGTGFQSYDNFEKRCEAKISKMILGHADALDSTPGKLGASQGDDNPAAKALQNKQVKDGRFVQNVINSQLLPKMRKLGFKIPSNYHFEFLNDDEKEEFRRRVDESNKVTADIAKTMKDAGLQMDAKYFEERTGIPTQAIEKKEPPIIEPQNDPVND